MNARQFKALESITGRLEALQNELSARRDADKDYAARDCMARAKSLLLDALNAANVA